MFRNCIDACSDLRFSVQMFTPIMEEMAPTGSSFIFSKYWFIQTQVISFLLKSYS